MATKTPAPASSGSFDDYVRCLRAEVDAAAKVRWEDPVAFLWRARRVGEALLHALRVRHVPTSAHEPTASIDGLLKHEQLRAKLGRENLLDLQGLQSLGNTGSHIQGEAINYEHTAGLAAAHLANVVAWFFRAQHPEAAVPDDVSRALDVLRDRARWRASPDNVAQRDEERIGRLTDELRRANEAAKRREVASVAAPTVPPRLAPWRVALAALGVALPALGGGLAVGRGCRDEAPMTTPVTRVSPVTVTPDAGVVDGGRTPLAVDTPTVPDDVSPTRCQDGTTEVLAWPFQLRPPPHRLGPWTPRRPDVPAAVTTQRVCLDIRVGTVGQLRAWHPSISEVFSGCARPRVAETAPMPCLSHDEAEAWCRSRGGRLPHLIEWEALARQPAAGADLRAQPVEGWLEWTADQFPPPVFDLRPAGVIGEFVTRGGLLPSVAATSQYPRYSWNRQLGSNHVNSLYVRCAFDPVAQPR